MANGYWLLFPPDRRIFSACRANTARKAIPPITISGISLNSTGLPKTSTVPSPMVSQTNTAKAANIAMAIQNLRSRSAPERSNFPFSTPLPISALKPSSQPTDH